MSRHSIECFIPHNSLFHHPLKCAKTSSKWIRCNGEVSNLLAEWKNAVSTNVYGTLLLAYDQVILLHRSYTEMTNFTGRFDKMHYWVSTSRVNFLYYSKFVTINNSIKKIRIEQTIQGNGKLVLKKKIRHCVFVSSIVWRFFILLYFDLVCALNKIQYWSNYGFKNKSMYQNTFPCNYCLL